MGYLIDISRLNNGFILTLLTQFSIGLFGGDETGGKFTAIHFGISKLDLTLSLAWRNNVRKKAK